MKGMNVKKAIRTAGSTPIDGEKKKATINAVARLYGGMVRKTGFFAMLRTTFSHTSVLFWLFSAALYMCIGLTAYGQTALIIGAPLFAALGFSEFSRSFYYGMWELEKTCRFDLGRLLLLKLTLTGFADLSILIVSNFLTKGSVPQLNCAVCTIAAFMTSSFFFFLIFEITKLADLRVILGGLVPLCAGASFLCRMANFKNIIGNLPIWLTVFAVFTVGVIFILQKIMRKGVLQNG